jgi:hypothetical protein
MDMMRKLGANLMGEGGHHMMGMHGMDEDDDYEVMMF